MKWQANFNIPDATVQVATAEVEVVAYTNILDNCIVTLNVWDEDKTTLIKTYDLTIIGHFSKVDEIYAVLDEYLVS